MNLISLFIDLTQLVQLLFRSSFIGTYLLYTPMGRGVTRRDSAHFTPTVKCIPGIESVAPRLFLVIVPFLPFFFGPNIKTEMGVVIYMYLKHSPDYIDSKYIWVHVSNSLGSSVFGEIPFLAFLALHRERKRCGQVGPSPCYSLSEVIYVCQVVDL